MLKRGVSHTINPMKRFLALAGLAALMTSCLSTGRVTVSGVEFFSQFKDDRGNFVICDNRNTDVSIRFDYSESQPGAFVKWKTRLFGSNDNGYELAIGDQTPSSPGINNVNGEILYQVGIGAGTAPLNARVSPQAVVVTPVVIPFDPTPKGFTRLGLQIFDDTGTSVYAYLGDQIRVVDNCP
jgi:hypothetical protein